MYELLTRRSLLKRGADGLAIAERSARAPAVAFTPSPAPFVLGIASGDPTSNSVVLWTRLATDPFAPDGGMPRSAMAVSWELATDPLMSHVVRHGVAMALAESAHAVHVRVVGLEPDRWYWYRFRIGRHESPLGRTRTFPASTQKAERLRLGFVSCQHWEAGFFTAYEHLAQEDLDVVFHLGDYIYEHDGGGVARSHVGGETMTLADYRIRHAQYRTDPALQAAHARFPFIVTTDDHGVPSGETPMALDDLLSRRANAHRAYSEHMPLGLDAMPRGLSLPSYRRFTFGTLVEIFLPEARQLRPDDASAQEPDSGASILGAEQERWLLHGLAWSRARWKAIAQQVMVSRVDFAPTASAPVYNVNAWDADPAGRNRLLGFIDDHTIRNVVVMTGGSHSSWVADLHCSFDEPSSPVVATEFAGTSISSGLPAPAVAAIQTVLARPSNAHVKFFDGRFRGYARCDIDEDRWRTDFRAIATVDAPGAPVTTLASFEVHDGHPGAVRA